jgi:hypothetical protein
MSLPLIQKHHTWHISDLAAYYTLHGHYYIVSSDNHPRWRALNCFLFRLRKRYKNNPRDPYLLSLFETLEGLEPCLANPNPSPKNSGYAAAYWRGKFKDFKKAAKAWGNPNIPRDCKQFPVEGRWLLKQRQKYQQGHLPAWQKKELEAFGIELYRQPGPDALQRCHYLDRTAWLERYIDILGTLSALPHPEQPQCSLAFLRSGPYPDDKRRQEWIWRQRQYVREVRLPYCLRMAFGAAGFLHQYKENNDTLVYLGWKNRRIALKEILTLTYWSSGAQTALNE